jgi:beta-N-acetylhexosaminidase
VTSSHSRTRGGCSRRAFISGAVALAAASKLSPAAAISAEQSLMRQILQLPLRDRVAQLFVFEAQGTTMTPEYAARLAATKPGGVLLVGSNIGTPAELAGFVADIQATNPMLPPLVTVDQEGGPVTRVPGDPVPGAVVLGKEPDAVVEASAHTRSDVLHDYGFDVNFAPVADVAYGPSSSMADRSFGSDPAIVARKVAAVVEGGKRTQVIGAAKHFPGHGRAVLDSHYGLPEIPVTYEDWLATDALPFRAAVHAGVSSVMLGHLRFPNWSGWDDAAASFSPVAVRVLRRELGFRGVIVTDDLGMDALDAWDPYEVVDRALAAGVDVLLYARPPAPDVDLISHVVSRVERGEISEGRLTASLIRLARMRANR